MVPRNSSSLVFSLFFLSRLLVVGSGTPCDTNCIPSAAFPHHSDPHGFFSPFASPALLSGSFCVRLLGFSRASCRCGVALWIHPAATFVTKTQKHRFSTTRWGTGSMHVRVYHPEKEAQTILAYVSSTMNLIPHSIRTRAYYESIHDFLPSSSKETNLTM